jgi:putative PIN family toxin of toxin-antitoxin system
MIGVVVDSNVYISALLLGESARQLIASGESRLVDIYSSEPIMNEVERVFRDKFRWSQERVAAAASYLRSLSRFVDPQCTVSDCRDPDDNRVLECAIEAKAAFIVTGDHHLLDLDPYQGIAILSPREFLGRAPWKVDH